MDRHDFLISLIEKINEIYDEIIDSEFLEPDEIDMAIDYIVSLRDELEGLIE